MRSEHHVSIAVVIAILCATPACAKEVAVRMLNKGPAHAMQFDPELVQIAPGDSVRFVASDKGHNAESVPGMIPAGAQRFSGVVGQDLTVTLSVPGVYGYRCAPHGPTGMVGLIVVGDPTNEEQAKHAQGPLTVAQRQNFERLFTDLDHRRDTARAGVAAPNAR